MYTGKAARGRCHSINHGVLIGARGGVTIGKYVRLSSHAVIETGYLIPGIIPRQHSAKPIVIADGVWVVHGCNHSDRRHHRSQISVIASGAVATRDVPRDSIAMGVPSFFIGLSVRDQASAPLVGGGQ